MPAAVSNENDDFPFRTCGLPLATVRRFFRTHDTLFRRRAGLLLRPRFRIRFRLAAVDGTGTERNLE